jgi:Domain of Unknown Function (DUF1080)
MRVATIVVLVGLAFSTGLVVSPARAADPLFRPLFDGKTLDGWEHVGPGSMVVENGVIRTVGGMGLLWYTRETFGDCVLRVGYKTTAKVSNSGVFVRIAEKPKDEWYAVHHGFEIQIADGGDAFHRTGAVYSLSKATASPGKIGEWNTMEITLEGQRILVTLNGVPVQDFNPETAKVPPRKKSYEPERGPRPAKGFFGLQNHDDDAKGTEVYFREVGVRPLEDGKCPTALVGSIRLPAPGRGQLEAAGGRAEADADLPEQVGLVLGEQVLHDHLVGGGHAGVLKDHAEPGVRATAPGVPDLDQGVGTAGDAVVLAAIEDGDAVEAAELVELGRLDHVAHQFRGHQFGDARLVGGGVDPHRLVVARRLGRAPALDHAEDLPLDQPRIPSAEGGTGDHELRK